MLFLTMVLKFTRSNEESTLKGTRVAAAFSSKRKSFAGDQALDKPYTRRLPAWLRWDDQTKAYAIIEERGALVREMFERADAGEGQHKIARDFNARGLETWALVAGKPCMAPSYVRKILSNRAAIGVFHAASPVGKGPANQTPDTHRATPTIDHRLPAVVDRELFERVGSRLATTAARGRKA